MKKIFNPVVGGKAINLHGDVFNVNESIETTDSEAEKLLSQYTFLVDLSLPQYQPSYSEKEKLSTTQRFMVSVRKIWHILKTNPRLK